MKSQFAFGSLPQTYRHTGKLCYFHQEIIYLDYVYDWKYQTQIVNTKLPNENLQTYQLQMIDFGGELPNANCEHQTTK